MYEYWHSSIECIRQVVVERLESQSAVYVIDSMPLEICKLSRAKRSRTCQEDECSSPDYGYCAAQTMHFSLAHFQNAIARPAYQGMVVRRKNDDASLFGRYLCEIVS